MGDTTTRKLTSNGRMNFWLLNTEVKDKTNRENFEQTGKDVQGIEIKEIRTVEDLDTQYQGRECS